jgi:hypothetical protein
MVRGFFASLDESSPADSLFGADDIPMCARDGGLWRLFVPARLLSTPKKSLLVFQKALRLHGVFRANGSFKGALTIHA